MSTIPTPASEFRLSRRTLLAGGAAVTVAATLGGLQLRAAGDSSALRMLAHNNDTRLSVGFVDVLIDSMDGLSRLAGRPVLPAAALQPEVAVDQWRLDVLGATDGLDRVAPRQSVHLDLLYDRSADEPLVFHAWTADADRVSISGAVTATMPTHLYGVGARVQLGDDAADSASVVLARANENGIPALRSGTYLLGIASDGWDRPTTAPTTADGVWTGPPSLVLSVRPG